MQDSIDVEAMTLCVAAMINRARWFLSLASYVDVLCRKIQSQRWAIHTQLRCKCEENLKVLVLALLPLEHHGGRCSCLSRPLAGHGEVAVVQIP